MSFDGEKERERLSQNKFIEWVMRPIRPSEMVTVYLSDHASDDHDIGIFCCLIPNDNIERSLDDVSWDLSCGDGHPGSVIKHEEGKEIVEYLRYGEYSGIEPLVIYREFYGMRENYLEISEEFRLEKVLSAKGITGYQENIKFLRDLQSLRSSGTAHRKGTNYRKIAEELGIDSQSLRVVFEGILVKGIDFLKYLIMAIRAGSFSGDNKK